jgi:hypothetical protein
MPFLVRNGINRRKQSSLACALVRRSLYDGCARQRRWAGLVRSGQTTLALWLVYFISSDIVDKNECYQQSGEDSF